MLEQQLEQLEIRNKAEWYRSKIVELSKRLTELQNTCTHPTATYEPKADTGNYLSSDRYWYDIKCSDCNKQWRMDQEIGFNPPATWIRIRPDYSKY